MTLTKLPRVGKIKRRVNSAGSGIRETTIHDPVCLDRRQIAEVLATEVRDRKNRR